MRKHLLLALALLIAALCSSAQVHEQDGDSIVPPGNEKYKTGVYYRITSLSYRTLALAGFISGQERETIEVPQQILDTISGHPFTVTSVAPEAFLNQKILKNVTIPATVTRIGKDSFNGCSIDSISIPGSVYHVEEGAFGYNPLKAVYICNWDEDSNSKMQHSIELQTNAFGAEDKDDLKNVYINYMDPPVVKDGTTPFPHVAVHNSSAKLHIPADADKDAYENSYCWEDFYRPDIKVEMESLDADIEVTPEYYTLQGVRVDGGNLPRGLYIVKAGSRTYKAILGK